MAQPDPVFIAVAFALATFLPAWIGGWLCDVLSARYPGLFEELRRSPHIRAAAIAALILCVFLAAFVVNPIMRPRYLQLYALMTFSALFIVRLAFERLNTLRRLGLGAGEPKGETRRDPDAQAIRRGSDAEQRG